MTKRDFIQETINTLKSSSERIEVLYNQFKAGEINKEQFEEGYKNIVYRIKEECDDEYYYPNNNCEYNHLG
jgi:hypothetical protein